MERKPPIVLHDGGRGPRLSEGEREAGALKLAS